MNAGYLVDKRERKKYSTHVRRGINLINPVSVFSERSVTTTNSVSLI